MKIKYLITRAVLRRFVAWVERSENPNGLFATALRGKVTIYLATTQP
jgi:hypothetical protein